MWIRAQILIGHFGLREGLVFTLAKHRVFILEGTTFFRFKPNAPTKNWNFREYTHPPPLPPPIIKEQPFIMLLCLSNVSDKSQGLNRETSTKYT